MDVKFEQRKSFQLFYCEFFFFLSHYRRILVYRKTWEVFEFIHHLPPLLRPHHLPLLLLHHLRLLRGLLLPHPRPHLRRLLLLGFLNLILAALLVPLISSAVGASVLAS